MVYVKPFVDSNTVNRCCVFLFVHYISGEYCSVQTCRNFSMQTSLDIDH